MTADEARQYLYGLSFHHERAGDTAYMHPDFAIRLATAIQQARKEGIMANVFSGFRDPQDQPSNFDLSGRSAHEYGLAADIGGIGPAGSSTARRWAEIAVQNGLSSPYNTAGGEYNHWQLPHNEFAQGSPELNALMQAKQTGDLNKMWAAYSAPTGAGVVGPQAVAAGVNTGQGPVATNDNRQIFFDTLVKAGLSPNQALGALWSMGGESHPTLDTNAYNPRDPGGAYGAAQWTQERKLGLLNYAASLGKPPSDPQVQADYLVQGELLGKLPQFAIYQKGAWDALRQSQTPADAARAWTMLVERPAGAAARAEERIRNGAAVGSIDANGKFVPGTARATVGGGGGSAPAGGGAAQPPAAPPQDPQQQQLSALGLALSQAFSDYGATGSKPQIIDPPDQPAIRAPAAFTDFSTPHEPVPAAFAGGVGGGSLGSQLGALGAQSPSPMLANPNIAPSITEGAPSMTAMLPNQGQIGWTGGMRSALGGPGQGANLMNPYFPPMRVS